MEPKDLMARRKRLGPLGRYRVLRERTGIPESTIAAILKERQTAFPFDRDRRIKQIARAIAELEIEAIDGTERRSAA